MTRFSSFKKNINPIAKITIKLSLLIATLFIFVGIVIITNILVRQLSIQDQRLMQTYVEIYRYYLSPDATNYEEMFFFLEAITPSVTFPIVATDLDGEPLQDYSLYTLNTDIDKYKTIEEQRQYLLKLISEMEENYEPILVYDSEGNVISKFYYKHSKLVDLLKLFPIVSLIIISIIVGVVYVAINLMRNNEQSKIWVGMARETAHQLGTPLSSLLAWLEILRFNKTEPDMIEKTTNEIENDLHRLNTIATRFSKIGSSPDKKIIEIDKVINEVANYYEKRLPNLVGQIQIKRTFEGRKEILANSTLISWVFENLIKNAAEAIEEKGGIIEISTQELSTKKMLILVKDNGKGMSKKMKLQIFEPGFTTKKRGWGIGLSLVKRIVEEYHSGKVYVKDSFAKKGTTFAIELPYE